MITFFMPLKQKEHLRGTEETSVYFARCRVCHPFFMWNSMSKYRLILRAIHELKWRRPFITPPAHCSALSSIRYISFAVLGPIDHMY